MELVVSVRECPEITKPANIASVSNPEASSIDGKSLLYVVEDGSETPILKAQEFLYSIMYRFPKIHDKACKLGAGVMTMDRNLFAELAINTQKAWEQLAEAKRGYEEGMILKFLNHIQANTMNVEQKYEDIQIKVAENNEEMARKLRPTEKWWRKTQRKGIQQYDSPRGTLQGFV
jgi:hypothetical protein